MLSGSTAPKPNNSRPNVGRSSDALSGKLHARSLTRKAHQSLSATTPSALAASSTVKDTVCTKIILKQCELAFGETVKAVGETDKFGNWSHHDGPELQWQEGHNWETELELFPGTSTFKLVIVHGDGSPQWEGGDNRSVMVPGDVPGGQVTFGCYFDQTASTEVQVTPAAAAAAQQDVIPDIQEHMVDEFAAGDAAPQVEAKHQANGDGANSSVIEDNLIDEFAAGDAAVQIEGVQGQADRVEQQAEARQQAGSPQQQSQATAVKQEVKEAAPKEDLEDTLSVLHGAGSDMQEQQPSQAPQASKQSPTASADESISQAEKETSAGSPDDSSTSQGGPQETKSSQDAAQSFPVFGKSKVSGIARDGSITFTFEEDDDLDLQELTSQLLG